MLIAHTTGAILAGGKSRRMGRDKALLEFNGVAFIDRIAQTLRRVFERVIIVSDHGSGYEYLNLPVYGDLIRDCGPLGGIYSAFAYTDTESVFIAPCDIPFLTTGVVHALLDSHTSADATVITDGGRIQPLCGVYERRCISTLELHLRRRQLRVVRFLENIDLTLVPLRVDELSGFPSPLTNINTIEEYALSLGKAVAK